MLLQSCSGLGSNFSKMSKAEKPELQTLQRSKLAENNCFHSIENPFATKKKNTLRLQK